MWSLRDTRHTGHTLYNDTLTLALTLIFTLALIVLLPTSMRLPQLIRLLLLLSVPRLEQLLAQRAPLADLELGAMDHVT